MKKIVIIEDNEDHAMLIGLALKGEELCVERFENGTKALEAFEKITDPASRPDLVLLDLKLPGIDGFGVLEKIRKMPSLFGMPVVMLTTSSRQEEIKKAYELGASGYVVKPDDFGKMTEKLKKVKAYWFEAVEMPEVLK